MLPKLYLYSQISDLKRYWLSLYRFLCNNFLLELSSNKKTLSSHDLVLFKISIYELAKWIPFLFSPWLPSKHRLPLCVHLGYQGSIEQAFWFTHFLFAILLPLPLSYLIPFLTVFLCSYFSYVSLNSKPPQVLSEKKNSNANQLSHWHIKAVIHEFSQLLGLFYTPSSRLCLIFLW